MANDEHSVVLVRETAERNGKKYDAKAVHITHPDSEGRIKEFWGFQENSKAADEFYA